MPSPLKKKGHEKMGGRKKGTPNKTTVTVKQAIQMALDGNADNLTKWLARCKGASGIHAYTALAEFVLPKLSRTEERRSGTLKINVSVKKENG